MSGAEAATQYRDEIVRRLRLGAEDPHNGYYGDMMHAADLIESMIDWLTDVLAYPYDFSTEPPIPSYWRSLIEDKWCAEESEEWHDAVRDTVAEEGRWLTLRNGRSEP